MNINITEKNNNTTIFNRCRIEWMKVLTPTEYMILDYMLFRLNLEQSNNGKGWTFHVRDIENQTGISHNTIKKVIDSFPFVKKQGTTRNMKITIDKAILEKWDRFKTDTKIVSKLTHRSTSTEVQIKASTKEVQMLNNVQAQQAANSENIIKQPDNLKVVNLCQPRATAPLNSDSIISQPGRQAVSSVVLDENKVLDEDDGFAALLLEKLKDVDMVTMPKEVNGSEAYIGNRLDSISKAELQQIKKTREQVDYLNRCKIQNKMKLDFENVFGKE